MGSSTDMEVHQLRLLELDTDHLYRHLTEVNGKDTRGGYIEGKLEFAPHLLESPFGLKISLVSDANSKTVTSGRVHPNLLYMTRFEGSKRKRDLEAATPLWRIELEIKNGEVYWWTESEAQALYAQRLGIHLKRSPSTGLLSVLELRELHLTVITPLLRTNVNGIKVGDGLAMRKPLFESLEEHEWEEILRKLNKFYTNKENKCEMDKVCLQFAVHRILSEEGDPAVPLLGQHLKEELEPMCPVLHSPPICNSKSRSLGILELIPDMVSCQKTCTRRRRTVFLLSKFPLVSEKEVFPRLVVRQGEEWRVDQRIRQPIDSSIVANRLFVFVMPEQEEQAVAEVYDEGGKVFLEAFRPRDKTSSNVKLEMELKVHSSPEELCSLCVEDPDRIGGRTMEESLQQRLTAVGTARPGVKRRRRENVDSSPSAASPPQDLDSSPASSLLSPEHLYHEIDGLDVPNNVGAAGWDLEDINALGMPDVLRGVVGRQAPSPEYMAPTLSVIQDMPGSEHLLPQPRDDLLGGPGAAYMDIDSSTASFAPGAPMMASRMMGTMMRSSLSSRYKESADFQLENGEVEDEPPGCSYMAESASLASSDLVDISPIHSTGMVESASLMSWPNVKKEEDSEEEQSLSLDDKESECSSYSSLHRIKMGRSRQRLSAAAPCLMVMPKEENTTERVEEEVQGTVSTIDLISRINSLQKEQQPNHEGSIIENGKEPRVLEMTKRFGGAKKKCMQRIRSNLQLGKTKDQAEEEHNAPTEENVLGQTKITELEGGRNSGCLPAIIYLSTPFLVTLVAWVLHCWFGMDAGPTSSLTTEE